MNEILCKECGNEINKHNQDGYHRPGLTCHQTPQDIAVAAIAEARREAVFMANVWKLYGIEFSQVVDEFGGDSNGIDFVANRILANNSDTASATLGEMVSNAYMEGMADLGTRVIVSGGEVLEIK